MFRNLTTVSVELATPRGAVFSGHAGGVEMRTTGGTIAINPCEESYLNLTGTTEILRQLANLAEDRKAA